MTDQQILYVDSKKLTVALHILWMVYSRVTYIDYQKESHKMIQRVVRETIDQTPAWFKKYKPMK